MQDNETIRAFLTAGKAVGTLSNPETGRRYTYRVVSKDVEDGTIYFVAVLTGPNNEVDYRYLGTIGRTGRFRATRATENPDAPSFKAFAWFWSRLTSARTIAPAEFHHEGRCGRCGRALTVPESIETGLGPVCATR